MENACSHCAALLFSAGSFALTRGTLAISDGGCLTCELGGLGGVGTGHACVPGLGVVWLGRCSPTSDASPIEEAFGLGGVKARPPGVLLPREPRTLIEKSAMGLARDFHGFRSVTQRTCCIQGDGEEFQEEEIGGGREE